MKSPMISSVAAGKIPAFLSISWRIGGELDHPSLWEDVAHSVMWEGVCTLGLRPKRYLCMMETRARSTSAGSL